MSNIEGAIKFAPWTSRGLGTSPTRPLPVEPLSPNIKPAHVLAALREVGLITDHTQERIVQDLVDRILSYLHNNRGGRVSQPKTLGEAITHLVTTQRIAH